jgi:hypothetical protein
MPQTIKIIAKNVQVEAELNDSQTAKAIINTLPIKTLAQRWGGEIYFSISVTTDPETIAGTFWRQEN